MGDWLKVAIFFGVLWLLASTTLFGLLGIILNVIGAIFWGVIIWAVYFQPKKEEDDEEEGEEGTD